MIYLFSDFNYRPTNKVGISGSEKSSDKAAKPIDWFDHEEDQAMESQETEISKPVSFCHKSVSFCHKSVSFCHKSAKFTLEPVNC